LSVELDNVTQKWMENEAFVNAFRILSLSGGVSRQRQGFLDAF